MKKNILIKDVTNAVIMKPNFEKMITIVIIVSACIRISHSDSASGMVFPDWLASYLVQILDSCYQKIKGSGQFFFYYYTNIFILKWFFNIYFIITMATFV